MPNSSSHTTVNGGDVWHEKQSYTLTYNQYFSAPAMSASLSVSRLAYWNAESNNNWMLSLNKSFSIGAIRGISASPVAGP